MDTVVVLVVLLASTAFCSPAHETTCKNWLDADACRCDESCAQYGDCCRDAASYTTQQQRLDFTCDSTGVYMMSRCPAEWKDPDTRHRCEHPDNSFREPLYDTPVTSRRANVTYRNWHCAMCHSDLDVGTATIWPLYFTCDNAWLNLGNEGFLDHLVYNTNTSSWFLNITKDPGYLIFENVHGFHPERHLYPCKVAVRVPFELHPVMRFCHSDAVSGCPEDWTNQHIRAECEAYISYTCLNSTVYRNQYCGMCNHNGSFNGSICPTITTRFKPWHEPDFSVLLDWKSLSKRSTCQPTEEYDPFSRVCRKVFESSANVTTIAPLANETSELDNCTKFQLGPAEYYLLDNETMTVFIPDYNRTYEPHQYRIENTSLLTICIPSEFLEADDEDDEGLVDVHITLIGVSLSVVCLILHLIVFAWTPKLRNLSSMNLASLSVSLLVTYLAFLTRIHIDKFGVTCTVMALVTQYGLLASFCWMLTISYDISRVLRQATTKLLISSGKHWQRFVLYSMCSWLTPAIIVGATLAVDFSSEQVPEDFRPNLGRNNCWFNSGYGLLIFVVVPLFVVMLLNTIFFIWSAYLIYSTTAEMRSSSGTYNDFRLYVRLALIMGLTWIIGLIAGFASTSVLWYLFLLFNTLQGFFIFLAFTCTKKVWKELRKKKQLLPVSRPTNLRQERGEETPGTASTDT